MQAIGRSTARVEKSPIWDHSIQNPRLPVASGGSGREGLHGNRCSAVHYGSVLKDAGVRTAGFPG